MEKRAVIDEEITPAEEVQETDSKIPPYQQKIAKILASTPVKIEDLDENHPTRRLMAGFKPTTKAK